MLWVNAEHRHRYKKHGVATLERKTRSEKHGQRKVSLAELAEAINEALPYLRQNKVGLIPKSTLYRYLLEKDVFLERHDTQLKFSHIASG